MKNTLKTPTIKCTAVIFLCFLLTSTGWLSWSYHLRDHMQGGMTDVMTMVIGYLLQAAGIGIFSLVLRYRAEFAKTAALIALAAYTVFLVPAVMSSYTAGILAFGFLMNTACGIIAGYYLYDLTDNVDKKNKATVFGIGYGLSILASWLLSLVDGVYYSSKVLIICIILTAAAFAVILKRGDSAPGPGTCPMPETAAGGNILLLAAVLVLLFSIVNSSGFAFPSADVGKTVNVEFSRLVYAAGLVIAGFVTDRSRKYGSVAALTALVIPFIILALRKEPVSAVIFWALSYFIFGFYAVFRVILFSDTASENRLLFMSGFGLLFGRIGDALGEGICLALADHIAMHICLTAVLFVLAVIVYFRTYGVMYVLKENAMPDEKMIFNGFCIRHDLSSREKDVLRLLLDEKTNSEIAALLFISENTVKFHVRNVLQKTGCANRKELQNLYLSQL